MNDGDYPALYSAADLAAVKNQRNFLVALGGNLSCLAGAAGLSFVSYKSPLFCCFQAIVLLCSLGLTIFLADRQPQRLWYGTRALAESVKTVTWRFMMRAEPFEGDEGEARTHFLKALREIFEANKQVSARAVDMQGYQQITGAMLANRELSLSERKKVYDAERVGNQHEWYIRKAQANTRVSKRWFASIIIINIAAIISALVRIMFPLAEHWPTDFLVVTAGSIMAWLQTKRYQELAGSYTLTAHEIGLLRAAMPDGDDERVFSIAVADAENAFSREHTQWLARRNVD